MKRKSRGYASLVCLTLLTALTQAVPEYAGPVNRIPIFDASSAKITNMIETLQNSMKNSNFTADMKKPGKSVQEPGINV